MSSNWTMNRVYLGAMVIDTAAARVTFTDPVPNHLVIVGEARDTDPI